MPTSRYEMESSAVKTEYVSEFRFTETGSFLKDCLKHRLQIASRRANRPEDLGIRHLPSKSLFEFLCALINKPLQEIST